MKIKVYNENGNIKITKITCTGVEQTMFSNLYDGEVAEIDVEANVSIHVEKDSISRWNDDAIGRKMIWIRQNII